jgi:hypothetical protein
VMPQKAGKSYADRRPELRESPMKQLRLIPVRHRPDVTTDLRAAWAPAGAVGKLWINGSTRSQVVAGSGTSSMMKIAPVGSSLPAPATPRKLTDPASCCRSGKRLLALPPASPGVSRHHSTIKNTGKVEFVTRIRIILVVQVHR